MRFYDRKDELKVLEDIATQSEKSGRFTVMTGRRRVGKTSLILQSSEDQKSLYLFVSRRSEALLCEKFQEDIDRSLGLRIFGTVNEFRVLFEQLLIYGEKEHYTLIIDEFQELERINPAIFSDIQDLWDRYKDKVKIDLIACGSIYSLMIRIFENEKEPLFGRMTSKIQLRPFEISVIKEILADHNPKYTSEDLLFLYMVTGGVPKYIAFLMDSGAVTADKMLDAVTGLNSPFLIEGRELLISEFGKDYGTYFSILQLIAEGRASQSAIDSVIGKTTGAYLANLEKDYSLISKNRPIFSDPDSRNIRWKIDDNYLRFFFRFIFPNQSLIETGRFDLLRGIISKDYESYSGSVLESYFKEKIAEEERATVVGGYWDRKGEIEIDIVAISDIDKTAIIAEVKRNPKKISMGLLKEKTERIGKDLSGYEVEFRGLSMDDM
jgi:AAA+ ATPase superfamily predicted ATPase